MFLLCTRNDRSVITVPKVPVAKYGHAHASVKLLCVQEKIRKSRRGFDQTLGGCLDISVMIVLDQIPRSKEIGINDNLSRGAQFIFARVSFLG